MREQDQVKALCEWAGWKWDEMSIHSPTGGKWSRYGRRFYEGGALEDDLLKILPDTNSLDVLHDFEKGLDYDQQHQYGEALRIASENVGPMGGQHPLNGFGCFALATVTAEQRRRALLVTLNLWREDSNEEGK